MTSVFKMPKKIFISQIILLGKLIIYVFSEIRIPFGIMDKTNNDSEAFINKITLNGIYTNLSFGTPPVLIQLNMKINYESFHLPSNLINTSYSKTMNCTSDLEIYIGFEDIAYGYYCNDIIYINNTEKRVNFILNGKKGGNYGNLGLSIPHLTYSDTLPFFQSLNKNNVINSYIWTLKYFKNTSLIDTIIGNTAIGELIFGDEPYKYENNKILYNNDNYHVVPALSTKGFTYWELEFNDIYMNSKNGTIINFEGTKFANIKPEVAYLVGPSGYFEALNEIFFQKYFDENICKEENIKFRYNDNGYISCDKEKFSYKDFPKLTFEHKLLENKFNLTGDDLFVFDQKTNKYMFLILTYKYTSSAWTLGSPFLKNHQLVFNEDAKTIGYYASDKTNSENNDAKTSYIVIICVLLVIIISVFIVLGILFKKGIIQLQRKKRANELKEDIIYEEERENKDKNNVITNSINI